MIKPIPFLEKMNKIKFRFLHIILTVSLFFMSSIASAQEDTPKEKKWNFTAAPYLILPSMNGEVGIGEQFVDVDADPGKIFDNLEGAFMFFFEASNEKWIVNFDFLYMKLGAGGTTPLLERPADVELKQLGLTFNGMYKVNDWAAVGVGFRINSIDQSFFIPALAGPGPGDIELPAIDRSANNSWVDPLIVARLMTRFDESNWRLGIVGDIGGFGIGSDLAWQLNPFVGYQFSKLFEIDLAYRWLSMDYNSGGVGPDYFLYDMVISGPEIGFFFHF